MDLDLEEMQRAYDADTPRRERENTSRFRSLECDDGNHQGCRGFSGALDNPRCGCSCHRGR